MRLPHNLRVRTGPVGSDDSAGDNGAFRVPSRDHHVLWCIASDGLGWEHVSVHATENRQNRVPSWEEMCYVKALFWDPEDVCVQYHPRESEYVNCHEWTLHIWRPIGRELPTPTPELVGIR